MSICAVGSQRGRSLSLDVGGASAGAVAVVAFALHVAALTLAPISIGQAVLAGGLVFLAVLAERFFGFELGRRQRTGIGLVAVSLALLTLTGRVEEKPTPATRWRG
jgi:drug/metabolite transporter (DMT)-like permease